MILGIGLARLFPDGGYLVRDESDGNGPQIVEWDRSEPKPSDDEITAAALAVLQEQARAAIQAEASRRISTVFPDWQQRKMTARGIELLRLQFAGTLTADDTAEMAKLQAAWDWIKAVRSRSDEIEAALAGRSLDDLCAFDPAAETWPALQR